MNKYLEDALPLIIAGLGGIYGLISQQPSDALYAVVLAFLIKTGNSWLASHGQATVPAPSTPPSA